MVITDEKWNEIRETMNNAFGVDSFKKPANQNMAFIFFKNTAVAIVRSGKEPGDNNTLHLRLSAYPATAAFLACLLQKHIDFLISDHYELNQQGVILSEDQAMKALETKSRAKPITYFEDADIDHKEFQDRKSKNMFH